MTSSGIASVITIRQPDAGRATGHRLSKDDGGTGFPTVKAFAILETMVQARRPLGISELNALLGLPKPTAHRILRMLENEGLIQREIGTRGYVPGGRLVSLGIDVIATMVRTAPRRAILEALSREVGETCNFGVMAGNHVVYLARVEAAWPFGLRFEPGSQVPLHCTSMGKLFLSALTAAQRRNLLTVVPLHPYTDNTIVDPERLEAELERIAADGVATDNQEFLAGVVCVAVPVRAADGRVAAGLAVSAPLARMSLERGRQFVPLLRRAAERMSKTIEEADLRRPLGRRA